VNQIIIHVDMDAFYASVEVRDNPALKGKPLIIGSLPQERGVVATCSYEARKFGVHSAMNIKEAYRLCPNGVFMHPNFEKYRAVSNQLHEIWNTYATASEYIALDEACLDLIDSGGLRQPYYRPECPCPLHCRRENRRKKLHFPTLACRKER